MRQVDLRGTDLTNAKLCSTELGALSGAILTRADLTNATISGTAENVNFTGATLTNAHLSGATLTAANLFRANLRGADLYATDFTGANISEADFSNARLAKAYLHHVNASSTNMRAADLERASVMYAYLFDTDLREAKLNRSYLANSTFVEAQLNGADASGSTWLRCTISNTDLRNLTGLETTVHQRPTNVTTSTLAQCRGRANEHFLRRCGLTEWEIRASRLYDPSISNDARIQTTYDIVTLQNGNPLDYQSVFLSHSSIDSDFTTKLYQDLHNAGIRCYFAPHHMQGGRKIHEQIDEAIKTHERLLLILSPASMSSPWVKTEIANARAVERTRGTRVLFPIRLVPFEDLKKWSLFDGDAGDDSAREIREYAIPDFSSWSDEESYSTAFEKLLRDLRSGLIPTAVPPQTESG